MNDEILIEVGRQVIDTLIKRKVINYTYLRNEAVKKLYQQLKSQGLNSKEARAEILKRPFKSTNGQTYFLTEKNIQKILYLGEAKK